LEKFEMKKTLVAIAAAAAVTGAMADVTISGQVDLSLNATSTTDSDGDKATTNSVGSNQFGQSQLVFSASEELEGGISAYAKLVFIPSNVASNGGTFTQDTGSGVGIKGAFGDIFLGNVYDQVWTVYAAADASGFGATSGAGSAWFNSNGVGAKSNSIVYTLPSMVTGLDVTVEQSYNTAAGVIGGTAASSSNTTYGDASGLGISYTSGPFYAKYATSKVKVSDNSTTGNVFLSYDAYGSTNLFTAFAGTELKFQALALTYDLGAAKLYYGAADMTVSGDTQTEKKSTFGLTVPFGAVTLGWGHSKADFYDGSDTSSISGDKVFVKYAFSKRTVGYITTGRATTTDSTSALTNSSVGLFHSF